MLYDELAYHIWSTKYRHVPAEGAPEASIEETWRRVARAVAAAEPHDREHWARAFLDALVGFRFIPAGRILAGAGTGRRTTLFNCFVMGYIDDSIESIFEHLKQGAITMQWGGGIGVDFSTLRPRGSEAATRGTIASGPVSFMKVWDAMCATLLSTGARRGAMMGTLRCDHPDVEEFIDAKRDPTALRNFNVSVQVTDELMAAVAADAEWPLCFPLDGGETVAGETRRLRWPGRDSEVPCRVVRRVSARALWKRIIDAAYDSAEPGVLFVDRINAVNNLYYCEHITTTNPCGEIPLPAYGACDLGSINLATFVREPFTRSARLDIEAIEEIVPVAVRLLDNVVDVSEYPLPEQAERARTTRRVGLGITGLGDALIMLGLRYDSDAGRALAAETLERIRNAAYRTSIALAEEKGAFPAFDRDAYLAGRFVSELPADIRDGIARRGIRNSHLLAIAPTGTISLLANNVSSGIEPVYAAEGERRVLSRDGTPEKRRTVDFAYSLWRRERNGGLPPAFVTAGELSPEAHLAMLAALQPLVDNSISKTINVAPDIPREDFASIYERAHALGLKGCTVFRPNEITGSVLSAAPVEGPHCCSIEREGD